MYCVCSYIHVNVCIIMFCKFNSTCIYICITDIPTCLPHVEPIGPPTELSIETGTNGHSVLKCTPPNNRINAVEVSYISKRTHETILVELHTCSYTFMTYGFPVTFSIVAVSLAGKGETAFLNYTVPSWCHITGIYMYVNNLQCIYMYIHNLYI